MALDLEVPDRQDLADLIYESFISTKSPIFIRSGKSSMHAELSRLKERLEIPDEAMNPPDSSSAYNITRNMPTVLVRDT